MQPVIDGPSGRTIKYDELAPKIGACAAGLAAVGFGKGDVLAILSPNLPEYLLAFHAVGAVGGIVTTLNPLYTATEISHQLTDAKASVLLTITPLGDKAREAVAGTGVKRLIFFDGAEDEPGSGDAPPTVCSLLALATTFTV